MASPTDPTAADVADAFETIITYTVAKAGGERVFEAVSVISEDLANVAAFISDISPEFKDEVATRSYEED